MTAHPASDPPPGDESRPVDPSEGRARTGTIGVVHGTVLYVGAVLGTGVLLLPALAVRTAGPASLIAWVALITLSVPLAYTFAGLAGQYPDSGGISSVVRRAFGGRTSCCTGWTFYVGVMMGVPSAAAIGGQYVADALGLGHLVATIAASSMLLVVIVANAVGLRTSGALQVVLAGGLAALLVVALFVAAPAARTDNWHPFLPHGWLSVGQAASLLMFAFVGWEAVTPLSAEFREPRRGIRVSTTAALLVTGLLYLGLAAATVAVLGNEAGNSTVPIADLMSSGLGRGGRVATAVAAVVLTLGATNAYTGGAAKLGSALARDRALPLWMAKGHEVGAVPVPSLATVALSTAVVTVVIGFCPAALDLTLSASSACFVAVYAYGCAAAFRLARTTWTRVSSVTAGVLVVLLLAFSGLYVIVPIAVAGVALAMRARLSRGTTSGVGAT